MNGLLFLSDNGENFLVNEEGERLHVYDDKVRGGKPYKAGQVVSGHLTVGVGHLIRANEKFPLGENGITKAKSRELFHADLKWVEDAIHKYVTVALNQNQYDALVSLVFNIGLGANKAGHPRFVPGFTNSTLLRHLNAGEYELAAGQFAAWHIGNGQPHLLSARRAREANLFRKPVVKKEAPSDSLKAPVIKTSSSPSKLLPPSSKPDSLKPQGKRR